MTWFEDLTGIRETTPDEVRAQIIVEGPRLTSAANGRTFTWGSFETPTLAELRAAVPKLPARRRPVLTQIVGDVRELHRDPANTGALFQVASQFKCARDGRS